MLGELARVELRLADSVELEFFSGYSLTEIPVVQKLSERYRAKKVGKGAHLSPTQSSHRFTTLRIHADNESR